MQYGLIGCEHPHVVRIVDELRQRRCEVVAYAGPPPSVPIMLDGARVHSDEAALVADQAVRFVICGGVPSARGLDALRALEGGKDVLAIKPAVTELDTLIRIRRVCEDTGRKFHVWFSERFDSPATLHALDLVRNGAIGRLAHVIGLGPHLLDHNLRPRWFFDRRHSGGVLVDLMSHQADQFLVFAGAGAKVESAYVSRVQANLPERFDDLGTCTLVADNGIRGFFRVDWLSPAGLQTWGDNRLLLTGSDGSIEVRKVIDPAGLPGGNHLILANATGLTRIQPNDHPFDFFSRFLADLSDRGASLGVQQVVFEACALAIDAERKAQERAAEPGGLDRASIAGKHITG